MSSEHDNTVGDIASSLKTAGTLVAKQAERTQVTKVTLQSAYAAYGKAVFKDSALHDGLGDFVKKVRTLVDERQRLKQASESQPAATSLTQKAQQMATVAAGLAQTKALDLRLHVELARLGKAAYELNARPSGLENLTAPIAKSLDQVGRLNKEINDLTVATKKAWISRQRAVLAGAVIVVGLLVAFLAPLGVPRQKQQTLPRLVAGKQPSKDQAERQKRSDPAVSRGIPSVPNTDSLLSDTVARMQSLNQDVQRSQRQIPAPKPSPPAEKSESQQSRPAQPLASEPNAAVGTNAPPVPSSTTKGRQQKLETKTNSIGMQLILIPANSFRMGDDKDTAMVFLSKPFWIGKHEVTQGEWKQVMGDRSRSGRGESGRMGDRLPAIGIGWLAAEAFCEQVTKIERDTGHLTGDQRYRLPTEAEWEYACRAGTTTKFSFGDNDSLLPEYAWCYANTCEADEPYAHEVGQKKPNAWGIHDMHGNVQEWCWDEFAIRLPGGVDPFTPPRKADYSRSTSDPGGKRTVRGGNWQEFPHFHRSCFRVGESGEQFSEDRVGFRVVLTEK